MKRILLFLATNLAVVALAGVVLSLLGGYVDPQGNLQLLPLLIFTAIFGFGGSFVSLWISKWIARRSTGAQVITEPKHATEVWLVNTVRAQAEKAGIAMPEVAVYDSPEINAFATGPSRNNSLVAVSTGLLNQMSREEAEAVLGHEVSHVANGDMVTMALLQGVLNTFVMFFARIVAHLIDSVFRNDEGEGGLGFFGYIAVVFVLEITFGLIANMIAAWFSRQREFRADAGGAALAGRGNMVAALQRLGALHEPSQLPEQMAAFGITGAGGLKALFSTHPPIETRIARLRGEA